MSPGKRILVARRGRLIGLFPNSLLGRRHVRRENSHLIPALARLVVTRKCSLMRHEEDIGLQVLLPGLVVGRYDDGIIPREK